MSRRHALDPETAETLYAEYQLWLSLAPKKLCEKYKISRRSLLTYARRQHKTRRAA